MNISPMRVFYGSMGGRLALKLMLKAGLPRLMASYLHSPKSKVLVPIFIRQHGICMDEFKGQKYCSFADFFARSKPRPIVDRTPMHFLSPCDGWVSTFDIKPDSSFEIKGSSYRLCDLLEDEALAAEYKDGLCLVFRLASDDYHRYAYIDSGYVHAGHYIEGQLHSVQPIACEKYPVFRLNRRCWTLMDTDNFGPVVQVEIGALAVGGIVNEHENTYVQKGEEKGHFELCGSTIVALLKKDRLTLRPALKAQHNKETEVRVKQGMWIADGVPMQ